MNTTLPLLALFFAGCSDEPSRQYVGADATIDGAACEITSMTRYRLPAVEPYGGVVQICTNCDVNTCLAYGPPCETYGAPCDTGGGVGTCHSCCADSAGVLRCSRIVSADQTPGNPP